VHSEVHGALQKNMRNILAFLCLLCVSFAQNRVIGEVTSKTATEITVKTDAGQTVNVPVTSDTKVLRIPPGETNLAKATAITFNDVNAGDRVLARTNQIIVISKTDLEQKHAADRAEWQKRGSAGKVTEIGDGKLTLTTSGGQKVAVATTPKTTFRRYAPESVRFSDAKPSNFGELKVGDQVRVLGDKDDGTVNAEIVVSGAFRNFAGTVVSVDASAGEIKVTDLETKKPVVVKVNSDSMARKMPPMMAQMIASRRSAEGAGGAAGPPNRAPGSPTPGAPPPAPQGGAPGAGAGAPGGRGFGGPGGGRDIGQMLERMPALNISELKPGDAVIVASTAGSDAAKANAIAVVAGVEPLLTGPPSDRRLSGPWSLDINIMP
jgi:hypothetical protein